MASGAELGGRPGRPRFGPSAHPYGLPWTDGGETRFWGAFSGKALSGGFAGPQFPDPVPYPDQRAHGHAYRDAPANLHSNGYPNGHTYGDGNGHIY
jgi:hypothetical protein